MKPVQLGARAAVDPTVLRRRVLGMGAAVALAAAFGRAGAARAEQPPRVVPPYGADARPPANAEATEVAVLAGGCFWGMQGVFEHVRGVRSVLAGYAGGAAETASYPRVGSGLTGHAESVQVNFDPRQISFAQILQIFFSVAHDPTELNRQGPDSGSQYRSSIFPTSERQARQASDYIGELNRSHVFDRPVVTQVETGRAFFAAEGYHQDFLIRNPTYPYIVVNDLPKIDALKRMFPQAYRAEPVRVPAAVSAG